MHTFMWYLHVSMRQAHIQVKLLDQLYDLSEKQRSFQRTRAYLGMELVGSTRRLALMNCLLHGMEGDGPLVVSCGTQQSELLVVVEPGGHVGRLPLSLSTCPRGGSREYGIERWSGGAVHQRVGLAAAVGG